MNEIQGIKLTEAITKEKLEKNHCFNEKDVHLQDKDIRGINTPDGRFIRK